MKNGEVHPGAMQCLLNKRKLEPFHVFPRKALFNKPLQTPVPDAVADMHIGFSPETRHISSMLDSSIDVDSLMNRIYTELYSSFVPVGLSGLQKRYTEFVASWLIGCLPAGSRVLEIGCHDGFLLNALKKAGHHCVGVEPSPFADYAKTTYGLDVRNEFFTRGMFGREEFDVVIMRHVIEHVQDPVDFVRAAVEVMKGDGIAYIEVPNSQWSLENSFFPEFHVDHISYFTMGSMSRLLSMVGLHRVFHMEAFDAYMRFPFLMALAGKSAVAEEESDAGWFLDFRVEDAKRRFVRNFDRYIDGLKSVQGMGRVAVWGSGSIGTQYAIDAGWKPADCVYVDPNPTSQGLRLSVTGHEILPPSVLRDIKPDVVLIASGWEEDVQQQVIPYITGNSKIFVFRDLITGALGQE